MKIDNQYYEIVKAAMIDGVKYYTKNEILLNTKLTNFKSMIWRLFLKSAEQLQYDDSHPCFVNGHWGRFHPHNPNWEMYPNNINDDHIWTMLKKIGKELNLYQPENNTFNVERPEYQNV
jgi:hypothetical protein